MRHWGAVSMTVAGVEHEKIHVWGHLEVRP